MSQTKIFGLIGNPIAHSLSPLMHNAAFKHLHLNAEYKLFPLKETEVESFIKDLAKNNISGINVTVPYKEKVIPFLNSISEEAKLIAAVNTVNLSGDKLVGFNTDAPGFIQHLKELGVSPEGKKIVVLGAGGAAKAVEVALAKLKPKSIATIDIDTPKAKALALHVTNFSGINTSFSSSSSQVGINDCDLLINATPIGMKESDPCLVPAELINKNTFVYDLIYNPAATKLLKLAKERGCKIANGLGMLLYQGVLAFEIWTGQKAPIEIMRNALLGGIR